MISYSKGGQVSPYMTPQYSPQQYNTQQYNTPQYSQQYSPQYSPQQPSQMPKYDAHAATHAATNAKIADLEEQLRQVLYQTPQVSQQSAMSPQYPMPQQLPMSPMPQMSQQLPMNFNQPSSGISGLTKGLLGLLFVCLIFFVGYYVFTTPCAESKVPTILGSRKFGISWLIAGGIPTALGVGAYFTKSPRVMIATIVSAIPVLIKIIDLIKCGTWCERIDIALWMFPVPIVGSINGMRWVLTNILMKLIYMIPVFGDMVKGMSTAIDKVIPDIPCL